MKETSFKWKDHFWYTYEHCKNDTANCKNAYLGTNVDRTSKGTLKFPIIYNPKTFENDLCRRGTFRMCPFFMRNWMRFNTNA